MDRLHIHFTKTLPSDVDASGIRKSCDVLIFLNIKHAMDDGIQFFLSHNGVILSPGDNGVIKASYFEKITDRDINVISKDTYLK